MFGYLEAAEEVLLILIKLLRLRIIELTALPAVTLNHLLRLHVLDETEQPVLPCNKEILNILHSSSLPGVAECSEAQVFLVSSEREGSQVTTRWER